MSHIFHPSMGFMAQNIAYASQNVIKKSSEMLQVGNQGN